MKKLLNFRSHSLDDTIFYCQKARDFMTTLYEFFQNARHFVSNDQHIKFQADQNDMTCTHHNRITLYINLQIVNNSSMHSSNLSFHLQMWMFSLNEKDAKHISFDDQHISFQTSEEQNDTYSHLLCKDSQFSLTNVDVISCRRLN